MTPPYCGRSTITVDPEKITRNTAAITKALGSTGLYAVVKAQAYGHGAAVVAEAAVRGGADGVCVATPSEAAELADTLDGRPCLLLGSPMRGETPAALPDGVQLVAHSAEQVERFGDLGVPFHVNIDTGLGRGGMTRVPARLPGSCAGVMTHLAHGHLDRAKARAELARFTAAVVDVPPGLVRHAASSGPFLAGRESWLDAVRLGQVLLGLRPRTSRPGETVRVEPALSWRTEVVHSEPVPRGQPVGYGGGFRAPRDGWISLIPVGYADGFSPELTRSVVWADGAHRPVCSVAMDTSAIFTDHDPGIGAPVTLIGPEITVDQHARATGMNNVELSVRLSAADARGTRAYLTARLESTA